MRQCGGMPLATCALLSARGALATAEECLLSRHAGAPGHGNFHTPTAPIAVVAATLAVVLENFWRGNFLEHFLGIF